MFKVTSPATGKVLDTSRSIPVALSEEHEAEREELFGSSQALRKKYPLYAGLGLTTRQGG